MIRISATLDLRAILLFASATTIKAINCTNL
jgi:hypothetical protein